MNMGDLSPLSRVECYQWVKFGTWVVILPDTWHNRARAWTDWVIASILWLGEIASLICSANLRVAAHKIIQVDPSIRHYVCCWNMKQPNNGGSLLYNCLHQERQIMEQPNNSSSLLYNCLHQERQIMKQPNNSGSLLYNCPHQEQQIWGFIPAVGIFLDGVIPSDLKIGIPVAALPVGWHCRVGARTVWPDVSILWLGEVERLISQVLSQCDSM